MDGEVHTGIQKIAEDEAGIKGEDEAGQREQTEGIVHCCEKDRSDQDTGNGGEEQPLAIPWIVVVVFVEDIDKALDMFVLRYEVIDEPMHDVFEEGPEEYAGEEYTENGCCGLLEVRRGVVKHNTHDRDIHTPDREGVRFG